MSTTSKSPRKVALVALEIAGDSSGFEVQQASHYFVTRRAKGRKDRQTTTYKRLPKFDILIDCSNHLMKPGRLRMALP